LTADSCELGATSATAEFGETLALLAEMATRPRFVASELANTRKDLMVELDRLGGDHDLAIGRAVGNLVFGPHSPYGFLKPLKEHTERVSAADLAALHAQLFQPRYATLIAVGDVRLEQVLADAARAFDGWKDGDAPLERLGLGGGASSGPRTVVIDRSNLAQVRVAIAAPLPALEEEEMAAVEVFVRALGGLSSPLRREVLEERGAAYAFGGQVIKKRAGNAFVVQGFLDSAKAGDTVDAVLATIRTARRSPLGEDVIERARASLLADFRVGASTNIGLSGMAAAVIARGRSLDDIARYAARVQAVTPEDTRRIAERYLRQDSLRLVLVGDLAAIQWVKKIAPMERWNGEGERVP
jgi:predicted Zn-dependent peptidase